MTASLVPLITMPSPAIAHLVSHSSSTDCDPRTSEDLQDPHVEVQSDSDGIVPHRRRMPQPILPVTNPVVNNDKPVIPDPWAYDWHALAIRREFRGRVWSGIWAL